VILIDRVIAGLSRLTTAINAVDAKATAALGAGGGVTGSGIIDFGPHPGSNHAKLVIVGQAGIAAGSLVEAWIVAKTTADHSADEHLADPPRLVAGKITPGVGFEIDGFARDPARVAAPIVRGQAATQKVGRPYGKWSVQWRWQ
jgi:hypothetical protein